jgi:hypothetical protein
MPDASSYSPVIAGNLTATIANAASLSDAIDISGTTLVGYIIPSSWTAADITFTASVDGTNFYNVYDQFGNEIKHTVSTSRYVTLPPSDFASIRFIKLRSGTSSSAITQGAERLIKLVTRAV